MHQTIKEVTEDIENFKFNTAIASLMELTNTIYQLGYDKEVFLNLIIMLSPIAPHFAEELWGACGNAASIFKSRWPEYDSKLLIEENITVVLQVNGKPRGNITVNKDISEEKLKELCLSDEIIKKWVKDSSLKKVIVVPGKLVNVVI